jgi:ABC-type Mn2+/Zn2+ transport system ATPase subunit
MIAHLVVGATGTGKTTTVKHYLSKIPNKKVLFIYDVNNEYREYYPYEFIDFVEFIGKMTRVKKAVMVFEESTIFLSNRSCNMQLVDILVRKRHTGNYVFLCFHSLRSVPKYILNLCNYITLFHTNDSEGFIDNTFQNNNLTAAFKDVQNNSNIHYSKLIKLY